MMDLVFWGGGILNVVQNVYGLGRLGVKVTTTFKVSKYCTLACTY